MKATVGSAVVIVVFLGCFSAALAKKGDIDIDYNYMLDQDCHSLDDFKLKDVPKCKDTSWYNEKDRMGSKCTIECYPADDALWQIMHAMEGSKTCNPNFDAECAFTGLAKMGCTFEVDKTDVLCVTATMAGLIANRFAKECYNVSDLLHVGQVKGRLRCDNVDDDKIKYIVSAKKKQEEAAKKAAKQAEKNKDGKQKDLEKELKKAEKELKKRQEKEAKKAAEEQKKLAKEAKKTLVNIVSETGVRLAEKLKAVVARPGGHSHLRDLETTMDLCEDGCKDTCEWVWDFELDGVCTAVCLPYHFHTYDDDFYFRSTYDICLRNGVLRRECNKASFTRYYCFDKYKPEN